MTQRHVVYISIILILLVGNLWYWWPRPGETHRIETSSATRRFEVEDFELKTPTGAENKNARSRRDLFQSRMVVVQSNPKRTNGPPAPPPKTPEQLEEEAARAELAQIKLVGVVFRGDKGQAFLTQGDQAYIASPGDKVGSRFTVESVATDAVQLKDSKTNVAGQIPVSGKP